jgi:hypothetical protein
MERALTGPRDTFFYGRFSTCYKQQAVSLKIARIPDKNAPCVMHNAAPSRATKALRGRARRLGLVVLARTSAKHLNAKRREKLQWSAKYRRPIERRPLRITL